MIAYSLTSGDGIGWAIDEDARLIREALRDMAHEVPPPCSCLIHSPFWMGLDGHHPDLFKTRFVLAHADNPPFFYLTQPEFARAQQVVDLWVARSTESQAQFEALGLPCTHIPYAIDETLFFPIEDRSALRSQFGIPPGVYVIGNFHRDSEGADLHCPKLQKAPELLVLICAKLKAAGAPIHVLLAGPRRHWIRKALEVEGIPYTFVGQQGIDGDDIRENTLSRQCLNELYAACDLTLIPSRWEGGPQSAMEAAAAKTKILSIPLGVARDILEPDSFFETSSEAVERILADISNHVLDATIEPQFHRWKEHHSLHALRRNLRHLYSELEPGIARGGSAFYPRSAWTDFCKDTAWRFGRRFMPKPRPQTARLVHKPGQCSYLDAVIPELRSLLNEQGLLSEESNVLIAGSVDDQSLPLAHYQLTGPDFEADRAIPGATLIAPTVHDAVNLRQAGIQNPLLVCPLLQPEPGGVPFPFVVSENQTNVSPGILQAISSLIPVVYPSASHHWYTVFHGGISYGSHRTLDEAIRFTQTEDYRALISCPNARTITQFFRRLLTPANPFPPKA